LALVRDAAREAYDYLEAAFSAGTVIIDQPCQASVRLLEAEMLLCKNRDEKVNVAEDHLHRLQKLRRLCTEHFPIIAYYCVQAESILAAQSGINDARYRLKVIERQKLQGEWQLLRAEFRGRPVEDPKFKGIWFGAGTAHFSSSGSGYGWSPFFEFDSTTTPMSIDFFARSPPAFHLQRAIYQVVGDTLVVCWHNDDTSNGQTRPTGFDTEKNREWIVYYFERAASEEQNAVKENTPLSVPEPESIR
jgi:uncharacterized protein (TIGR03067 family)